MLGHFHFFINLESILNNESAQLSPFLVWYRFDKIVSVYKGY